MSDDEKQWPPKAPSKAELPAKLNRVTRGGGARDQIEVSIEVVTPIFGGSAVPRKVDRVDVIRAASIRGHLRFWWRALNAHKWKKSKDLYRAEAQLWGGPTGHDKTGRARIGRSLVELKLKDVVKGNIVTTNPSEGNPDEYVLYPPGVERWKPTIGFTLIVSFPLIHVREVRAAIRAWLLFGGYGGRTRRGLGSLTVAEAQRGAWLPSMGTVEEIEKAFAKDVDQPLFEGPKDGGGSTPVLRRSTCKLGEIDESPDTAWLTAVSWLREFRQGPQGGSSGSAREEGSTDERPGRSNWPEADKIRYLMKLPEGKSWAHSPERHGAHWAWPRAALGLPIIFRFQPETRKSRGEKRWEELGQWEPPGKYRLVWGTAGNDRMASPLIVKPLALANGKYVPMALWLSRPYPPGDVYIRGKSNAKAPFEQLLASGDKVFFQALRGHTNIKDAFFDWLEPNRMKLVVRGAGRPKDGSKKKRHFGGFRRNK